MSERAVATEELAQTLGVGLRFWRVVFSKRPTCNGAKKMNATRPGTGFPTHTHATAKVVVNGSSAEPFDHASSSELIEISMKETFAGDISGESQVRALEVRRNNQTASLVSLQRVSGRLGKRQGTFVLQGSETITNGKIKATWFVVPGTGTGELAGLRGEGGFEGEFGKGSEATLDYWFE